MPIIIDYTFFTSTIIWRHIFFLRLINQIFQSISSLSTHFQHRLSFSIINKCKVNMRELFWKKNLVSIYSKFIFEKLKYTIVNNWKLDTSIPWMINYRHSIFNLLHRKNSKCYKFHTCCGTHILFLQYALL